MKINDAISYSYEALFHDAVTQGKRESFAMLLIAIFVVHSRRDV